MEITLCLTILALLTSTTIYVVIFVLSYQSDFLRSFITSGRYLWLPPSNSTAVDYPVDGPLQLVGDYAQLESCAGTVALTINVCSLLFVLIYSTLLTRFYSAGYLGGCDHMLESIRHVAQ